MPLLAKEIENSPGFFGEVNSRKNIIKGFTILYLKADFEEKSLATVVNEAIIKRDSDYI